MNKKTKKVLIITAIAVIVIGGGFLLWKKSSQPIDNNKLTLKQAAKMGEVTTQKLLVQIERPKGSPENLKGRYERGDIVLVASADKQFSEAEKTGFLILKMDLTPKQAEILTLSLTKGNAQTVQKDKTKQAMPESLKRRKFYVDLSAVGIADNDEQGREIGKQIYKWDILREKK